MGIDSQIMLFSKRNTFHCTSRRRVERRHAKILMTSTYTSLLQVATLKGKKKKKKKKKQVIVCYYSLMEKFYNWKKKIVFSANFDISAKGHVPKH